MRYFWLAGTVSSILAFMVYLHYENWICVGIWGFNTVIYALNYELRRANTEGGR